MDKNPRHILTTQTCRCKDEDRCPRVDQRLNFKMIAPDAPVLGEDNPASRAYSGQPRNILRVLREVVVMRLHAPPGSAECVWYFTAAKRTVHE